MYILRKTVDNKFESSSKDERGFFNMDKKKPDEKKIYKIPQTVSRNVEDPEFPIVSDPPVPNRAHTEMRVDFPPEFPEA